MNQHPRTAVDFASLVGKFVSITRRATAQEQAAGEPEYVGGQGVVVHVKDAEPGRAGVPSPGVIIEWDYGRDGLFIPVGQDRFWRFEVWADELAANTYRTHMNRAPND